MNAEPLTPATSLAYLSKADNDHTALRANCPPILRITEAAEVLTVSRRTIAELLAQGAIASKRIGRRRIVTRAALEKYLGVSLA